MSATVGKYVLKAADNAADWIKNIEFGKSADAVEELGENRAIVMDIDTLLRQSTYSKEGREKAALYKPGGLPKYSNNTRYVGDDYSKRYANFIEFAEQTDQPIHMPTLKIDQEEGGFLVVDDGMLTLRAMRDAGLKEIPVMVRKQDVREILPNVIVQDAVTEVSQSAIPVTKPVDFKPKELTPAQQRVFDYETKQQGRPAHTAKSIALGELDMNPAAKAGRRADEGFTGTSYHGGSPDVTQVKDLPDGFWTSKNPVISNSYTRSDSDFRPSMYEIAYNPSQMGQMNTYGYQWNQLEGVDFDLNMPGGDTLSFADDLEFGGRVTGEQVQDTNDLARLATGLNLKGIEIDQINDMGNNIGQARRSFRDIVEKENPGATGSQLEKAWGDFLKDYETSGATNVVITDPSVARSATGAAFDPRNRALPNIMGGSAALAVGLGASNESEAGSLSSFANKSVDLLMEMGYPESTAKKIASGSLPMDLESRMARASEQGFTDTAYHTGTMETVNQLRSDRPFFAAADPAVAASYSKSPLANPKAAYRVMINPSNNAVIDSRASEYTYALPRGGVVQLPSGDFMTERDIIAARPDLAFDHELEYFSTADAADLASDQGASGVTFNNLVDLSHSGLYEAVAKDTSGKPLVKQYEEGSTIYAQTDPSTVRLEKAAFDPDNIGLPYLMGGSSALAVGLGSSNDSQAADAQPRITPEFAARMFDRIVSDNPGREKNAYIPVKPTTMDYVQNAGRAIVDYFGTDPGKDMLGGLGQEIAVEGALGSLGQMIFGPAGAVGFASFMPNVAGDPTMDMLNDQGQPMTEAEFAAYRRQLRGN